MAALRPDVVQRRLVLMDELLDDLASLGEVSLERLHSDRLTRRAVERILTHLVDLAVDVNTHVVSAAGATPPDDMATPSPPQRRPASSPTAWPRRSSPPPASATSSSTPTSTWTLRRSTSRSGLRWPTTGVTPVQWPATSRRTPPAIGPNAAATGMREATSRPTPAGGLPSSSSDAAFRSWQNRLEADLRDRDREREGPLPGRATAGRLRPRHAGAPTSLHTPT